MAEQDARGKFRSVNMTESIIQKIIQQMEEKVITAADTQHKQDQGEVNRMLEDTKKCRETMEDKFNAPSNGVNALKQNTDTAKSALTTCKTDLVGKIRTKGTECMALTSFVKGLSNSKPKCVCTLAKTPSQEVLECIQEAKSWGTSSETSYIDLKGKCDTATSAVATKEEACNTDQRTFESAFCSYGEKLTDTCQDFEKCHSDKSAEYSDSNKEIKVAETSRKQEFVAAKKVICFVGVLKAKAAEKSKNLKACIDKTYDTSHLDMSYPVSPIAATCDISPVANKPCDRAFISAHYEASWSKKAPAATCVPCAWSAPAPLTTQRCNKFKSNNGVATHTLSPAIAESQLAANFELTIVVKPISAVTDHYSGIFGGDCNTMGLWWSDESGGHIFNERQCGPHPGDSDVPVQAKVGIKYKIQIKRVGNTGTMKVFEERDEVWVEVGENSYNINYEYTAGIQILGSGHLDSEPFPGKVYCFDFENK